MIDLPPVDHDALIQRFAYPTSKQDYWLIEHTWGTPLLLQPGDALRFKQSKNTAHDVTLNVMRDSDEAYKAIPLHCVREQLCTTFDEVDLVFRIGPDGALLFDQDLEDGGAPSNGGKTGKGDMLNA